MKLTQRAGLIRFETLVWLLVGGVLVAVLLQQLAHYQALANAAVIDMTVANMRSGLRLRLAELMIGNRGQEMNDLLTQNPIVWLDAPPVNYLGQLQQPDGTALVRDNWYYDAGLHELIYMYPENNMAWAAADAKKSLHVRVVARQRSVSKQGTVTTEGVSLETHYQQ